MQCDQIIWVAYIRAPSKKLYKELLIKLKWQLFQRNVLNKLTIKIGFFRIIVITVAIIIEIRKRYRFFEETARWSIDTVDLREKNKRAVWTINRRLNQI